MDSSATNDETRVKAAARAPSRIGDYGCPAIISLLLLVTWLYDTAKRPYWEDEILTSVLAADRQFGHMFAALRDSFNTSPPVYHVLIWCWAGVFGSGPAALRLFTTLCFCAAYGVLWGVLKRRYGRLPAALGISLTIPTYLMQTQLAEARNYGLYLFLCSLVVWCFDRYNDTTADNRRLPLWNFLAQTALIFTHVFGLFYSGILLVVSVVSDLKRRNLNLKFYASTLLAWFLFVVLWLPTLQKQKADFTPYSWVVIPKVNELILACVLNDKRLGIFVAVLIGTITIQGLKARRRSPMAPASWPAEMLLGIGVLFTFVPQLIIYYVSHHGISTFVGRYFIPSAIGWATVIASLFPLMRVRIPVPKRMVRLFQTEGNMPPSLLFGFLTCIWLGILIIPLRRSSRTLNQVTVDMSAMPANIPIVFDDMQPYLANWYYSQDRARVFFLLDLAAAKKAIPDKVGYQVVGVLMGEGLKRRYPFFQIAAPDRFFTDYNRFLVFSTPGTNWMEVRLLCNPDYECRPFTFVDPMGEGHRMFLVEKRL